jgi:hypothetical protein
MTGGVPQPSASCARGEHDQCPHWVAMSLGGLWRRPPRPELILCNDSCHNRRHCRLAGRRKAPQDEWSTRCTCPGADTSRRSFAKSEEKRREMAALFADLDLTDHPDPQTIERRIRRALQAHGEQTPPFLQAMSRLIAAGTGPKGTRSARLLGLGAGAATRAVRWAWQPGTPADAKDRRSLRRMYASLGALTAVAVLLTAAAVRATGWRRAPWALTALLAWLFTAQSVSLGALVTAMVRMAQSTPTQPRSQPS